MPDSDSPRVIDGFSSVQAVRHSGRGSKPRLQPSRTRLPAAEHTSEESDAEAAGKPAARIGHTVRPQSFEIECYDCGYVFKLTGRLGKTFCPKCRKALEVGDYTIDTDWSDDITTIGRIDIAPAGSIKGARFLARDMSLAGSIEEASGYIFGCLELHSGARFDPSTVKITDVRIPRGEKLSLRRKLVCRNLDVEGELRGRVHVDGVLKVRAGGLLRGDIHTPHLIVEEGGGLKASLRVGVTIASPRSESAAKKEK